VVSAASTQFKPRVVAVAGGRGGVGKSLLAANMGIFLATLGKRVVLVDGALGSANAHLFVGVARPSRSISEALSSSELSVEEFIVPTPVPGLRLIAGVGDPAWVAVPEPMHVAALIAMIRSIDADYVVLDLAPGTATYTVDLFLSADVGVLVAVPEPTSIELFYRFVRAAFVRKLERAGRSDMLRGLPEGSVDAAERIPAPLDLYLRASAHDSELASQLEAEIVRFRPHLVINAVRSKADMEMGPAVASAGRRRLGVPVSYLGHLEYDEAVWVAVRRRRPLMVEHPESRVSKCMEKVTRRLLAAREPDLGVTRAVAGSSHYELLEIAPTASFEDIRRANRRIREIYGRESVVISGMYSEGQLDELHRRFDDAYTTLMDAAKRKEYDYALFPDGVPSRPAERLAHGPSKVEVPAAERPPMPAITKDSVFTGGLLQQVREARGIDLREIAERTKISMAYLQALESETFKKLPAVVYMRGFLAEYAKYLGLDRQRVVETYLERYRAARSERDAEEEGMP
jgi:flagellar biosynthesis protein FlhG